MKHCFPEFLWQNSCVPAPCLCYHIRLDDSNLTSHLNSSFFFCFGNVIHCMAWVLFLFFSTSLTVACVLYMFSGGKSISMFSRSKPRSVFEGLFVDILLSKTPVSSCIPLTIIKSSVRWVDSAISVRPRCIIILLKRWWSCVFDGMALDVEIVIIKFINKRDITTNNKQQRIPLPRSFLGRKFGWKLV